MGNIVLLDELTINQIAAGEVIERPANVVKELVENSLDAGATSVSIEVQNGGITYIRITDNGKGIARDDVEIAFERHATSKIRKADDLIRVSTMGFRGEALASIAAIAKVELVTRTKDEEMGTKIIVEGGNIISKEECGAPFGTTITIRELFYNTPVRYKFLKKDFTEGGYIETAVERIALINPSVAFKLINNKKEVLQTSGNGNMTDVVYNVFGKDIAQNLADVAFEYEGINVTGVVGKPEIARSNRANQMFYVNGRFIKDKTLTAAADEAYRTMIPHGKFGFCILNIKMPPELVDVNVHPAKLEVRFSEEGKVFKAIHYAIKNTLLGVDLIKTETISEEDNSMQTEAVVSKIEFKADANTTSTNNVSEFPKVAGFNSASANDANSNIYKFNDMSASDTVKKETKKTLFDLFKGRQENRNGANLRETTLSQNEYVIEVSKSNKANDSIIKKLNAEIEPTSSMKPLAEAVDIGDTDLANLQITKQEYTTEMPVENQVTNNVTSISDINEIDELNVRGMVTYDKVEEEISNFFEQTESEKAPIPEYKILGVAFNTYILLEIDDDVYILDQHAAHERVLYEKVKENFYRAGGKETQMLLLPDILEVSRKDMHMIRDHVSLFEQAGFAIEEFGDNTIKINGVPVICFEMNTKDLFMDILDGIDITNRTNAQDIEEKFISTVACKAAVKANMKLEEREIRGLLDQLMLLENPFTCPHGRPTAMRLTKTEIEKKFNRR
ncbi:MAG: DNA mismatch repair endonuclease MutL [Clostridia bacterium]|nr:DNA mismatch repair endonuclease MutL [Clostridia bacterium]